MVDLFSYLLTSLLYFKMHFHLMDIYSSLLRSIINCAKDTEREGGWICFQIFM